MPPSSLLLFFVALVPLDESEFSGPQPNEAITPFKALQVSSPERTQEIEIAGGEGKGTTLLIFLHKVNEPAIGLMIPLEWYAHRQEGLRSHYVILSEDRSKTEEMVKRWAARPFFAASPFSISLDGEEGPGRYGLNRNVILTVLIAKDQKVVHNFAFTAPNQTDAPEILAALAKTLDQPVPDWEKLQGELRAERGRRREMRMRERPLYQLAPHPQIGRLMTSLVFTEDRSEERSQRVADEMRKWAGEDKEKQTALADYAQAILNGKLEVHPNAREQLRRLAER